MQSASQKDALPHTFRSVRTAGCACPLCVTMQTSIPTAKWLTWWYDSSHICIPAASREALHVHGNNEVLFKNRPASFSCPSVYSMICQVLPAQVFAPVALQAVHPFSPPLCVSFIWWSNCLIFSSLAEVAKLALFSLTCWFRKMGKSPNCSWISGEN